jgi:hypothetical protein
MPGKEGEHISISKSQYFKLNILMTGNSQDSLVVERVLGVSEVKDNTGVRLGSPAVGKLLVEVNSAVERKASILLEINVKSLEVSWGIDDTNLASLDEVISDNQVLLVRSDLDVMGSDGGLVLIGVIETLDVVQVTNVKGGDMVGGGQGSVEVLAILADVGAGRIWLVMKISCRYREDNNLLDSDGVTGLRTEVEELLNHTLIAIGILA